MPINKYHWLQTDQRLLWISRRVDALKNLHIPFTPSLYETLFKHADLVIPDNRLIEPYITLSHKAVLTYPHVESNGKVCLQTELRSTVTEEQFINQLIDNFCNSFLKKIASGEIQHDFYEEPEPYWAIYVDNFNEQHHKRAIYRNRGKKKTVGLINFPRKLLLLDKRFPHRMEYIAILLGNERIIAGTDSDYKKRVLQNYKLTQKKIMTLEIPINKSYIPHKWPKNLTELSEVISIFIDDMLAKKYIQPNRLVILRAPNCNYAYFINHESRLIPIACDKADIEWIYGRYKNHHLIKNQSKKIVCFGAGSLGSQVIPLLVKEGIGEITVVDYDKFKTPNLSRHLLGMNSLDQYKVSEIEKYISTHIPTCHIKAERLTVDTWLEKAKNNNVLDAIELFIDLTGSEEVRNILDEARCSRNIPLISGWMEPFVSAAHVAYFPSNKTWKISGVDLWEEIAAFKGWPNGYMQNEPGCSSRFQSYSGIETLKAVSMITEACIDFLNHRNISTLSQIEVTSLVRSPLFCEKQEYQAEERANWAKIPENLDSVIIKRFFK